MKPALPQFDATYGVAGRMSSAVDLVQGLGVLTGIEVVDVPGATAGFDNDYAAQARACLRSLDDRDLFVLHVEATDEAGHQGLADVKVDALERWDADVIGPIVDALDAGSEPYRDPAAARPRDAVHDQDAHRGLGAVPAVRLRRATRPAACTPSPRPHRARRCPRTS